MYVYPNKNFRRKNSSISYRLADSEKFWSLQRKSIRSFESFETSQERIKSHPSRNFLYLKNSFVKRLDQFLGALKILIAHCSFRKKM